ncbi:uncharacterized protein DUF3870 [Cytobacillus oceanisediminis]|jgi:hypothetical protein|uniref:Uncharacterized protein DUF3870 n=1 Tax=Cytobacillus oceanisediminis TaxID=665099 RepID=A0A2V3A184_9BACI|nr:DUF3870 domain-containing protein [Cytobacillus oceanisediminis]PWW29683.1 uncharacterized protein DUF3870 [Cytobacillus oceanisediminis]
MIILALESVVVTGYAKAPQGTSMHEVYKHAGIVLEINFTNHEIIRADFTFITELTKDFFERILIGYSLKDGVEPLLETIKRHYFAPSQQAIIVALQAAIQRYWDNISNTKEIEE